MINPIFGRNLVFSLLGHLAVFGLFNLTFGSANLEPLNFNLNFRGAILKSYEMAARPNKQILQSKEPVLKAIFDKANYNLSPEFYVKPQVMLAYNQQKESFKPEISEIFRLKAKPMIMFYPRLPNYFNLYFKDRQVVHIELLFNIKSDKSYGPIEIKRKVSSGNLEADLLSMRYISHYLFIEKAAFAPNSWQSVKIELSPKND